MSGSVIAGVDGSPRSLDALTLAGLVASALEADLVPVHVSAWGNLIARHQRFAVPEARRTLEELLGEAAEPERRAAREQTAAAGAGEPRFVSASSAAEGLHRLTEELDARLVVLGSPERAEAGRVLPGSTGRRLLAGSPVPVAIAPGGYRESDRRIKRIGCGLDDKATSYEAVAWAADLATRASAALELITVHPTYALDNLPVGRREDMHEHYRGVLDETIASLDETIAAEAVLLDGNPAEMLGERSSELDLLVLGSRGYGPIRSVLLGSVSAEIVRASRSAVAVVPKGADAPERTNVAALD